MREEKLFSVQVVERLEREIKVSAVDEADAIKMAKELVNSTRVELSREYDLADREYIINGVEE